MPLGFCTSATMWSRGRDISGELMPEADFAGVDRRATGVRGGSEKNRLSERRGAAISSLEIPSPQYGGDRGHLPSSRSPGSRSPASAGYSPQYHPEVDYAKLNSRSPTGKSGIRRAGTLGSGRGGSTHFLRQGWHDAILVSSSDEATSDPVRHGHAPLRRAARAARHRGGFETVAGRLGPSDDKDDDEDGAIFARRWNRRGKGGRAESWTEIISAVGCDVAGNRRRRRSGNAREWVGGSGGCRIIVVNEGV